jgi:drug/metabolite transporter (DMT)-like permease
VPPPRARVHLAVASACLAAACWGVGASIAKYAFDHGVPPTALAEARALLAAVVLGALLAWRNRALLRAPRGSWPLLAGFGCSLACLNFGAYVAIDRIPVGVTISIIYAAPVLVLGWTVLVGRRRGGGLAWVAAAVTLAGAVLVTEALDGFGALDPVGLGAAVGAAGMLGAGLLLGEALGRRGLASSTTVVWGFAGAVVLWSVAAPWWRWPLAAVVEAPATALAVVGVGLVGTLLPSLLQVGALRVLSAAIVGIVTTSEPLFAAGFAWLLLGQALGLVQVVGGGLVVAGVVLAHLVEAARLSGSGAAPTEPTVPLSQDQ